VKDGAGDEEKNGQSPFFCKCCLNERGENKAFSQIPTIFGGFCTHEELTVKEPKRREGFEKVATESTIRYLFYYLVIR
jgi:hypothetical protein